MSTDEFLVDALERLDTCLNVQNKWAFVPALLDVYRHSRQGQFQRDFSPRAFETVPLDKTLPVGFGEWATLAHFQARWPALAILDAHCLDPKGWLEEAFHADWGGELDFERARQLLQDLDDAYLVRWVASAYGWEPSDEQTWWFRTIEAVLDSPGVIQWPEGALRYARDKREAQVRDGLPRFPLPAGA